MSEYRLVMKGVVKTFITRRYSDIPQNLLVFGSWKVRLLPAGS